ncbi:ACP phosphodiesterase [Formosa sp. A9]|uniref:acyl carrier protein phosphodiesterase n=1 Tax=Formosa sp. A9 TaxID=3442641 RepID=UPI003EC0A526
MNYLAHIYLSEDLPQITIGNFIADGIRGKSYLKFPKTIQTGVLLHRFIDSYTDSHPIVRKSTKRLHPKYHHYSGVIVDIYYDHFLAKNWTKYTTEPLSQYAETFYQLLQDNYHILPERTQQLLPYMIKGNWLVSYASLEGIESVLIGMNKRTKYQSNMNEAIQELVAYYNEFETEFTAFFEDLQQATHKQLIALDSKT